MRLFIFICGLIMMGELNLAYADTNFAASKPQIKEGSATLQSIVVSPNIAHSTVDVPTAPLKEEPTEYTVGIDDILTVAVLQPEQILNDVVVSPDGSIAFPYIGNFNIKGMTINEIQKEIQSKLADGYLKYPSVVVSLKESRSRKFYVYGEVIKPGPYQMEEKATVLRAISMAGGFTRFGSASRVKILRPKSTGGYELIQVNIKSVMDGNSLEDITLKSGDIIVVSEGIL